MKNPKGIEQKTEVLATIIVTEYVEIIWKSRNCPDVKAVQDFGLNLWDKMFLNCHPNTEEPNKLGALWNLWGQAAY